MRAWGSHEFLVASVCMFCVMMCVGGRDMPFFSCLCMHVQMCAGSHFDVSVTCRKVHTHLGDWLQRV